MRRARLALPSLALTVAFALCAVGCPSKKEGDAAGSAQLAQEVKGLLAERDRKLHAYQIAGSVTEAGQTAQFEFAHRAPNRMLATLKLEQERTFAFSGDRLVQLSPSDETAVVYDLQGDTGPVSVEVHRIFGAIAPEGFRAPLVAFDKARAQRVSHPRGPQAVALTQEVTDEAGLVRATWILRWPSMDLLEKRLSMSGVELVVAVTKEHCDERLKLCVPTRLEQTVGGEAGAVTELSQVELNKGLAQDAFAPEVPQGWTVEQRSLVSPAE